MPSNDRIMTHKYYDGTPLIISLYEGLLLRKGNNRITVYQKAFGAGQYL
jgi:hypothetical protein